MNSVMNCFNCTCFCLIFRTKSLLYRHNRLTFSEFFVLTIEVFSCISIILEMIREKNIVEESGQEKNLDDRVHVETRGLKSDV